MPSGEANFEGISEAQLRAVFDSIPTRIALLVLAAVKNRVNLAHSPFR